MKCEKPLYIDKSMNPSVVLSFFCKKDLPVIYSISNFVSIKKMY